MYRGAFTHIPVIGRYLDFVVSIGRLGDRTQE
jgi:hypothetical protein